MSLKATSAIGRSAGAAAKKRWPAFERLQALVRHADGLGAAVDAKPQIDAIVADRRLLAASDPVPTLAREMTDALRIELTRCEGHFTATYDRERKRLEESGSWRKIEQHDREAILARQRIEKFSKGATGTVKEVLESLERISLDDWRTRAAALPQQFADARQEADRLVEPKIRHVKISGATLRTPEEVRAWVETTEQDLLEEIRQGPIAIQ